MMTEPSRNIDCACLDSFLNDELSPAHRVAFLVHLKQCPECHSAAELEERWSGMLSEAKWSPMPQREQVTLAQRLEQTERHQKRVRVLASISTIAAALLMGSLLVLRPWTDRSSPPVAEIERTETAPVEHQSADHAKRMQHARIVVDQSKSIRHVAVTRDELPDNMTLVMFYPVTSNQRPDSSDPVESTSPLETTKPLEFEFPTNQDREPIY